MSYRTQITFKPSKFIKPPDCLLCNLLGKTELPKQRQNCAQAEHCPQQDRVLSTVKQINDRRQ